MAKAVSMNTPSRKHPDGKLFDLHMQLVAACAKIDAFRFLPRSIADGDEGDKRFGELMTDARNICSRMLALSPQTLEGLSAKMFAVAHWQWDESNPKVFSEGVKPYAPNKHIDLNPYDGAEFGGSLILNIGLDIQRLSARGAA